MDRQQGAIDCEAGLPPKNGMPESYYLGYSEQYEKEQQLSRGFN
jgi:hypothetical protein